MKRTDVQEEQEGFVRGYHDIPSENILKQMSFVELAAELASSEKDSPKFISIERELKKHIVKDQAKINRFNIILGACIGGIFSLVGVVVGYCLNNVPRCEQVAPAISIQNMNNDKFTVKPTIRPVAPSQPPITRPIDKPTPIQNNAQPGKP